MTQTINRRCALAIVAAAPAALATAPAFTAGRSGELAALVRLYFEEVRAFNASALESDEESDALADATYSATLGRMIGTPARTADDALAALDWLVKEGADLENEYGDDALLFGEVVTSLVDAIRGYIEGMVS